MSNLVLYRKYRPKKFSEVVNQEHIKTTLANAVANNRVGHAYLFIGPRGVGKTTLARIFARAINCTNRQGSEPCNECEVCKSFFQATSLDLLEIDAASNRSIDNVRELIEHLQFAPSKATYKVIIIDEVHQLTKEAFNALLKTLEEPPAHAVFILATTEVHKVPPTIISRTQRFDFKRVNIPDLAKLLKFVAEDNKVKISDEALQEIASAADGSFRDGLSLLDQVINFADGEVTEDLVEQVLGLTGSKTLSEFFELLTGHQTQVAVGFIGKLMYAGKDLHQFNKDFLEFLRKQLLQKISAGENSQDTVRLIGIFQKAEGEMKWAVIQSLPLELAAVEATASYGTGIMKHESGASSVIPAEAGIQSRSEIAVETQQDEGADAGFAQILSHWPQILDKIKDYNHSLISSMKLAKPTAVEGKELVIVFPYKFHKDVIDARKNRIVIDQVIEDVTGLKLMVKPVVEKELQENKSADTVGSALKIMGGSVEK